MFFSIVIIVVAISVAWVIREVSLALWNTHSHPLRDFPDPQIAAGTTWYKTWQEVFLGRSWVDVLQELHEQHGEVVRVGPNEVVHSTVKRSAERG